MHLLTHGLSPLLSHGWEQVGRGVVLWRLREGNRFLGGIFRPAVLNSGLGKLGLEVFQALQLLALDPLVIGRFVFGTLRAITLLFTLLFLSAHNLHHLFGHFLVGLGRLRNPAL